MSCVDTGFETDTQYPEKLASFLHSNFLPFVRQGG